MQREIIDRSQHDLHLKIKSTERDNGNMDGDMLEQYLDHLYGIEERIASELVRVAGISDVSIVLSVFESKLKVICDRIIADFGGELKSVSNSVIDKYWKFLRDFLGEFIGKVENSYTFIKNTYVLRNVLVHQDAIAKKEQSNSLNGLKNIEIVEFEGNFYVTKIGDKFTDDLADQIESFFIKVFTGLQMKTNEILG
ncbi:hypothetical protein [Flavobacterium sp. 2]|uniref:hypothetical protein n=1 Tax=Flavobacterium sp. 2 TaxID=308053 RepID=UPI001179C249|nr:hypothetical protein [Flavobacterium sp. 2]